MVEAGAFAPAKVDPQLLASKGSVKLDEFKKAIELADLALSLAGEDEDGGWVKLIERVSGLLPDAVMTE